MDKPSPEEGPARSFTHTPAVFTHAWWLSCYVLLGACRGSCRQLTHDVTRSPSAQEGAFPFKAHQHWKHRYPPTAALSTPASAQECQESTSTNSFKHRGSAPPWIWAFHTLCTRRGTNSRENFVNSFVKAKKRDWLLSNPRHAARLTPQILQHLSSEPHSWPTQAEASCKDPG